MSSKQLPILVLKEGTQETKNKDAQNNNIDAAKLVAQIVKIAWNENHRLVVECSMAL